MAKWWPSPPSKAREYHLKRLYGITLEQYNHLLERQQECCGVCKKPQSSFKKWLAVDHDHVTGEVRGLLCQYCNQRVIGRHRLPQIFMNAYQYLTYGHTDWYVPKKKKTRKKRKKRNVGTR